MSSRFPLALTDENRRILKEIKYLTDKTFTDIIIELLNEYLPVKLKEAQAKTK